jgi:hypothetical protein
MSNAFGPRKPLFGPYTYRAKQNSNGDTLIAVYVGSKRIAHMDAYWAYSMRSIEDREEEVKQRGRGRSCATDLRALGAEGKYPNVLAVSHAFITDDAHKGKGVGRAMYEAMMTEGFAVRESRIGGKPGPMFFIPDECSGAGNTSAEARRVWASLVRDYPSQGTSIRVDAPPIIGSRAKVNPRPRRNPDAEVWYHGRKARSRKFDLQFVGGREATNQEGPGFYFTTSPEEATVYTYPNGVVLRATLNVPKWVSRTKRPVRSEIERLMRASPNYEDALTDWDESPYRAHAKALAVTMQKPNQHEAFLTTWAEFYRRSGHSADYLRELASMGYGGVKADRGESQHAVVFSPAFVENVEVYEDTGTGPIENPRRRRNPAPTSDASARADAFREWFRNSKIVDENGEPLVVYHGGFDVLNSRNGTFRKSKTGTLGSGIYFTPNRSIAENYVGYRGGYEAVEGGVLTEVYLSIQNPLIVRTSDDDQGGGLDPAAEALILLGETPERAYDKTERIRERLGGIGATLPNAARAAGYDGIIRYDSRGGHRHEVYEIVAFEPWQVKSATRNAGTYYPYGSDIRTNPDRWQRGKCLVFAEALKRAAGRKGVLYDVVEDRCLRGRIVETVPHHVVLRVGTTYWDSEGPSTEAELLARWEARAPASVDRPLRLEKHDRKRARDFRYPSMTTCSVDDRAAALLRAERMLSGR